MQQRFNFNAQYPYDVDVDTDEFRQSIIDVVSKQYDVEIKVINFGSCSYGRTFEGIIDISADRKILAAELKKDLDVIKGVPWQISIIEKLDDNT